MSDLRIYAACLAAYNAGRLHGAWIDCEGKDADELQEEVSAMLRASPCPNVWVDCPDCDATGVQVSGIVDGVQQCGPCPTCNGRTQVPSAEEFAIHDFEGFGDLLGEFSRLEDVAKHAAMIAEHGDAWSAYCSHVGEDYATEEGFQEAYQGTWDSERAFAEDLIDQGVLGEIPEALVNYIDADAFARDLFIGDYWRDDDTGAVFSRH